MLCLELLGMHSEVGSSSSLSNSGCNCVGGRYMHYVLHSDLFLAKSYIGCSFFDLSLPPNIYVLFGLPAVKWVLSKKN